MILKKLLFIILIFGFYYISMSQKIIMGIEVINKYDIVYDQLNYTFYYIFENADSLEFYLRKIEGLEINDFTFIDILKIFNKPILPIQENMKIYLENDGFKTFKEIWLKHVDENCLGEITKDFQHIKIIKKYYIINVYIKYAYFEEIYYELSLQMKSMISVDRKKYYILTNYITTDKQISDKLITTIIEKFHNIQESKPEFYKLFLLRKILGKLKLNIYFLTKIRRYEIIIFI